MTPQEANALLTFARQNDHLVVDADGALETWANHLAHIPLGAGKLIVQDYYGKHPDPENRKPIDASFIRKLYSSKHRELAARQRALEPPPPRAGSRMPRHVLEKLQARGILTDRNPHDYQ